MEIAIIGFGQRGTMYAENAIRNGAKLAAVVDTDQKKLDKAKELFGLTDEVCFSDCDSFFERGKIVDAVVISTLDKLHYDIAMRALDLRYPLLLEKPISIDPVECMNIRDKAMKLGVPVTVAHVLRYTSFFKKIKEIIDSGEIGKIVTIQHNENIGNFHMAHSFVRGNWRRSEDTAPIMLTKSCHDLDILIWLTDSIPESVASFGDLRYFKKENAPSQSAERCIDCPVSGECRFDARRAYLPSIGHWPATVLTLDQTEEGLMKAIKEGPYGQCVFKCDNDVCDHQVSIIRFKNGVTATFNLSGFTNRFCRTLKIMCEDGEIRANMDLNLVEVIHFSPNKAEDYGSVTYHIAAPTEGHGGGDMAFVKTYVENFELNKGMSSAIEQSVASHILAFAAEKARLTNSVVNLDSFEDQIGKGKL